MMDSKKFVIQPGIDPIGDAIREAAGAAPEDVVVAVTPQHGRESWAPVPGAPPVDWGNLRSMSRIALREMGCRPWNNPDDIEDDDYEDDVQTFGAGNALMLFPSEWYDHVPVGFEIVDIFGKTEKFVPGETDDDIRFGCLSYGVLAK